MHENFCLTRIAMLSYQWWIQDFIREGSIIRLHAKFLQATPILVKTMPISARFSENNIRPLTVQVNLFIYGTELECITMSR